MPNLKELLKKKLNSKELSLLVRSFDVIGDLAIIEVPKGLSKKEKLIAKTVLNEHKNIKGVFKKYSAHKGIFRTKRLKFLAGENRKTALHKENGVQILLDIEKCYFSPRLSNERLRIAKLVKPKERILVMFSGVAPYQLVIAKNSPAEAIYGIELNRIAHKFAYENVIKNKFEGKIKLFNCDVKKVATMLNKKFDRIIMPLPKSAESYLNYAFKVSKKGAVVHMYAFMQKNSAHLLKEKVRERCKKLGKKCSILRIVMCGKYSPRVYRVCVDFRVY